ncbi:beta-galactosidase [Geodermatophilus marinus]|uniref:beta-galactosidase n=1 Tax=Geodermatophilus sp. LHW52908 TaxID=2303986 RepID=UPI0011C13F69|nr:beta-galactosidase [Geodermatophilus sp. LHW52908]
MARHDLGRRAPGRGRRRNALALVVTVLAAAAAGAAIVSGRPADVPGSPDPVVADAGTGLAFGVLGSRCDPERVDALSEAGVRYAEMGLSWASFEPVPGEYDLGYAAYVRRHIDECDRAGIGVVFTLGLHSAPGWVAELPGGAYVNQHGDRGDRYAPNVVFSQAVRDAVAEYLAALDRAVGLDRAAAIRVGTGIHGELGYPGGESSGYNPFWAFDAAAQEGVGLADGAEPSPLPGWIPGSSAWNGTEVGTEQVREWYRWYSRSVADAVIWVVRTLRDQGYERDIHFPLAGRGALPADLEAALAARMDGTADRDGSFEQGLFYPEQLPHIAGSLASTEQPGWGSLYADSSSVDDATAVTARQLDPPQDSCRPGDADRDLLTEPDVGQWSSVRWTMANARTAGLGLMGENPGSPDTPRTGGNDLTDSAGEQMDHAPRYALECGMSLFMWAFEDDLFGERPGAGIDDYAARIRAARSDERRPGRKGTHR